MKKRNHKMWTKDELRKVLKVWDSKTTQELADEFSVGKSNIQSLATRFRKMGVPLTRKHQTGYLGLLMKEVASEYKKR